MLLNPRELKGREVTTAVECINTQRLKTTESGGILGFDASKKSQGRQRYRVVDTIGLLFGVAVPAAYIQDWDGENSKTLGNEGTGRKKFQNLG